MGTSKSQSINRIDKSAQGLTMLREMNQTFNMNYKYVYSTICEKKT